jgi:hypothetical protein
MSDELDDALQQWTNQQPCDGDHDWRTTSDQPFPHGQRLIQQQCRRCGRLAAAVRPHDDDD